MRPDAQNSQAKLMYDDIRLQKQKKSDFFFFQVESPLKQACSESKVASFKHTKIKERSTGSSDPRNEALTQSKTVARPSESVVDDAIGGDDWLDDAGRMTGGSAGEGAVGDVGALSSYRVDVTTAGVQTGDSDAIK